MKPTELRIGNWINTIEGPAQVREITDYERLAVGTDKRVVDLQTAGPIPLTEEILLKAGFFESYAYLNTQYKMRVTWLNGSDIRLEFFILEEHEGKFASEHCFNRIILYVHQLQNLFFALTGQELEINL